MLSKTLCIFSILLFLVVGVLAVDAKENSDWRVYLGGKERNLYSTLKQINRDNVSKLEVAWTFETGDKAEYQANNLIVDGLLYTPTPTRKVVALDAATGEVRWTWDPAKDGPGKGRALVQSSPVELCRMRSSSRNAFLLRDRLPASVSEATGFPPEPPASLFDFRIPTRFHDGRS